MTTTLDLKFKAAVDKAFAKFNGGVDVLITPNDGTYDGATAATGAGSAPFTAKATPPAAYDAALANGVGIQVGDLTCLLKGTVGFTPKNGWSLTVAGSTFAIVTVTRLSPGDDVVAWELQLRQ